MADTSVPKLLGVAHEHHAITQRDITSPAHVSINSVESASVVVLMRKAGPYGDPNRSGLPGPGLLFLS